MIRDPETSYIHFVYNCNLVGYVPSVGTLQAMSAGISDPRRAALDQDALQKLAEKRERDRLEEEAFANVLARLNESILTSKQ